MTGGVRPRRGGRIGTAIAVGSVLAPLVMKGVEAVKKDLLKKTTITLTGEMIFRQLK